MGIERLPAFIGENYEIHKWKHACAVLTWIERWILGGGGGGCPILIFGIKPSLYV